MHERSNVSTSSTFVIICFFMIAILLSVKCCHIVVLTFISLIVKNANHLYTFLLGICVLSLEKCLSDLCSLGLSGCSNLTHSKKQRTFLSLTGSGTKPQSPWNNLPIKIFRLPELPQIIYAEK